MTLTKNAIGNLVNKYRAVLSKCRLLNTLGSLAVAGALVLGMGGAVMADSGGSNPSAYPDFYAGSYSPGGSNATGGNVIIDAGKSSYQMRGGLVMLGHGNANNNSITMTGGEASDVRGGATQYDDANGNRVTISGGRVTYSVIGGSSADSGSANGNTVTISGGTIGNVYGGYAGGTAANNTVIYSGGTINGGLYGGFGSGGSSNNTLVSIGNRTVGGDYVAYFQNYRFVVGSNNVGLTLTSPTGKFYMDDNTNKILGVDILGGGSINEGDTLTLVKSGNAIATIGGTPPSSPPAPPAQAKRAPPCSLITMLP